jgi:hypothetical protein
MEKLRIWLGSALMSSGVFILPKELRSFYILVFAELERGLEARNAQLMEKNREYYRGNN